MGIGSIKAMDGLAGAAMTGMQPVDSVSKNIQNKISDVQRQKQELSAKEDIAVEEKRKKRQELQQELSRLNAELRQRQAQSRREQKKEALADEMQAENSTGQTHEAKDEEEKAADSRETENKAIENIDTKPENKKAGISERKIQGMAAADSAIEQEKLEENVIARMEGGIVILKGEIRQDEARGEDVEKKQAELEKREKRMQRASQITAAGKPRRTAGETATVKPENTKRDKEATVIRENEDRVIIKAANLAAEIGISGIV